ncbi:MAG: helix-turn-helix transcriptional regulator [Methylocystis sp.]
MDQQLVDRIYECAFVPEMWPDVLREIAKIATARTGVLQTFDGISLRATASNLTARMVMEPFLKMGYAPWNAPFVREIDRVKGGGFYREVDHPSAKETSDDEWRRQFATQDFIYRLADARGVGRLAGTFVELPTSNRLAFLFAREWDKGAVEDWAIEQLDQLRPHLIRAGYMAARLQLDRARAATQTLASLGLAALVLDTQGKVLAANELIQKLSDFIFWRAQDRLTLRDSVADKLFNDALAAIGLTESGVRSFPARNDVGAATFVCHVVPIRRAANDIFSHSAAVLVMAPVSMPGAPPVELVQSLFDLTPAEARVARGLASGQTVDDLASAAGLSTNTVRTHVRRVLEKTGCNRQTDVVALLTSIGSARPPDV